MRLIILLFLLISFLESAPSISECKYESFKAKTCLKFITADHEKIGPKEEFDAKKSKFQDFFTCFGEPKCEHSRMLLKIEKTWMDIMEKFSEIYSCLGNRTYERHQHTCQWEEKHINRADPKFAECMIEKFEKEEKCSSADLEKFKESMKVMPGVFTMIRDYKKKEEEVRKMSDKKNDN